VATNVIIVTKSLKITNYLTKISKTVIMVKTTLSPTKFLPRTLKTKV